MIRDENKTQEALKMAIEALEDANGVVFNEWSIDGEYDYAINACKKALESQDQFGAAYMEGFNAGKMFAELESQEQEPWGWYENHDIYDTKQSDESIALYAHPAQPLSDDEIDKMILNNGHLDCVLDFTPSVDDMSVLEHELRRIARAIEKAHGIV